MRIRVLVVNDQAVMRRLMADTLASCGAEVVAVSSGEAALDRLRIEKFDGIFLDLLMPGAGGLELTREIRKSSCNRAAPVVIVTGLDHTEIAGGALAAGATFFLHKPVDRRQVARLFETIREAALDERRRSRRIPLDCHVTWVHGIRGSEGRAADISESGILFRGNGSLRKDDTVTLHLRLPGEHRSIWAEAMVARVDESKGVGCRFTDMGVRDRDIIHTVAVAAALTPAAA